MLARSGRHAGQLVHRRVDQLAATRAPPLAPRAGPGRPIVAALELLSDTLLDEALPFPWDTVTRRRRPSSSSGSSFAVRRVPPHRRADRRPARPERGAGGAGSVGARPVPRERRHRLALGPRRRPRRHRRPRPRPARGRRRGAAARGYRTAARAARRRRAAGRACRARWPPPATATGAARRSADDRVREPRRRDPPVRRSGSAVVRLSAPLRRGGETIGLLAIGAATPRGFDADEVETLASLANQAAIALEHDRLEARLRELAVVEERERIARELHDGIAQVLGLREHEVTRDRRIPRATAASTRRASQVDRARCRGAGGLRGRPRGDPRPAEPDRARPRPGWRRRGACPACRRRLAVRPRAVDIPPEARDLRLDAETEAQVYRIVQEALTNVRKHAAAQRVRVSMAVAGGQLDVRIEDDGRGLAAADAPADVPLRAAVDARAGGGDRRHARRPRPAGGGGIVVALDLPLAGHVRTAGRRRRPAPTPAAVAADREG